MQIQFVSASPGAGKTFNMMMKAADWVFGGKSVLFLQPTCDLIMESVKTLNEKCPGVPVFQIHHKVKERPIGPQVLDALRKPYPEPHILFVTWASFFNLPFFPNKHRWNLIGDEIPQVVEIFEQNLRYSHTPITSTTALGEGEDYAPLSPKAGSEEQLRAIAENRSRDAGYEILKPLAKMLRSGNWNSYVTVEPYQRLIAGRGKKLTVFSLLKPDVFSGFESVTIMGACFKESLMFKAWRNSISFKPFEGLDLSGADERMHSVEIRYCLKGVRWSKAMRKKPGVLDKISALVKDLYSDVDFCWSANKDIKDGFLNGKRLPSNAFGLNGFTGFDHVVLLSANNLAPAHITFLAKKLNVEPEDVTIAIHPQVQFQNALRCSLRSQSGDQMRSIFVPDEQTARYLHEKLKGSRLIFVDAGIEQEEVHRQNGRKRLYLDDMERQRACRDRKKAAEKEEIDGIRLALNEGVSLPFGFAYDCHKKTIIEYSENVTKERYFCSIWANLHAEQPTAIKFFKNDDDIIRFFEECHNTPAFSKDESNLITMALMDPTRSAKTIKGKDNVIYCQGVMLDSEHGDLTPKGLAQIFCDYKLLVFNSFNSKAGNLRFRAYFFTDTVMSGKEYGRITKRIRKRIEDAGYTEKSKMISGKRKAHGLDLGKLHCASFFYLPSHGPDESGRFFEKFIDGRKPLCVSEWLEDEAAEVDEIDYACSSTKWGSDKAEMTAIQWFEEKGLQPEHGDSELFKLGGRLHRLGRDRARVGEMLQAQAARTTSPEDRAKQVPRILRRLFDED